LKRINLICPVQSNLQKYSASSFTQIKPKTLASRTTQGRIAIVTDAERDAVDAGSAYLTKGADADGEVVWS
jgi:hypothetical protein